MRLVLVTSYLGGGGAARVLTNMANYWAAAGHDVVMLSYEKQGTSPFYSLDERVELVNLAVGQQSTSLVDRVTNNFKRLMKLRQTVKELRPDCVVSFVDVTNVQVALALQGCGCKVVVSERIDPAYEDIGSLWSALRRIAYPLADCVVVQTEKAKAFFAGWSLKRLAVIPNSVQPPTLGQGEDIVLPRPAVVAAGRLMDQKNYSLMIRAFAGACRSGKWHLCIAGEGRLQSQLQGLAEELGVADKVHFMGQVRNMKSFFEQGEAFLMSSDYEGFPNALCEAMAMGLPVLSTDCPSGPAEVIEDGRNGLLVPCGDEEAFMEGFLSLTEDAKMRERLGKSARMITQQYGENKIMAMWESCIANEKCEGMMERQHKETPLEERFAFGKNWAEYLTNLSEEKMRDARESLQKRFPEGLEGKTFLDIGCGSGLFSLGARELGAKVLSFDFDPDSVSCAKGLKKKYFPDDEDWEVFQGSVLDSELMDGLGQFDVVYSWGVLHHTGDMWQAMENAIARVAPEGAFYIAIYNDQGGYSDLWRGVKKTYVKSPEWVRFVLCLLTVIFYEGRSLLIQLVRLRNPIKHLMTRKQARGMSLWIDARDWVGGYPFEVAMPEEIFEFSRDRGFVLEWLRTNRGGIACNEYLFKKK